MTKFGQGGTAISGSIRFGRSAQRLDEGQQRSCPVGSRWRGHRHEAANLPTRPYRDIASSSSPICASGVIHSVVRKGLAVFSLDLEARHHPQSREGRNRQDNGGLVGTQPHRGPDSTGRPLVDRIWPTAVMKWSANGKVRFHATAAIAVSASLWKRRWSLREPQD